MRKSVGGASERDPCHTSRHRFRNEFGRFSDFLSKILVVFGSTINSNDRFQILSLSTTMTSRPLPNPKSILPVIHCESTEQALRNTTIAVDAGCAGVFLINHSISAESLLGMIRVVRASFSDLWLGANFLGMGAADVFGKIPLDDLDGIWTDDGCVDEHRTEQPAAEAVQTAIGESGWSGTYFGGVAFKYQREVDDLTKAAEIASRYMDVVCTSGPGTGKAASIEKLKAMKLAIGDKPLAVASGITPENVSDALPWVDLFLVSTGISRSFTELDAMRVQSLVSKVMC